MAADDTILNAEELTLLLSAESQEESCSTSATLEQFWSSMTLPDPSRYIRLFELYPAQRLQSHYPLTGHIRVVNLDEAPVFTALSYVWGDKAIPCDTITCKPQNFNIEVTANCYSALWHLRKKFGGLTIWIDSICINQNDKDEKAAQIPLMSKIYAGADITYVWLGPGNHQSDKAMDYLSTVATLDARLPFNLLLSPKWPSYGQYFLQVCQARIRTFQEAPGWYSLDPYLPTCPVLTDYCGLKLAYVSFLHIV
jgi:hypothetical protein